MAPVGNQQNNPTSPLKEALEPIPTKLQQLDETKATKVEEAIHGTYTQVSQGLGLKEKDFGTIPATPQLPHVASNVGAEYRRLMALCNNPQIIPGAKQSQAPDVIRQAAQGLQQTMRTVGGTGTSGRATH